MRLPHLLRHYYRARRTEHSAVTRPQPLRGDIMRNPRIGLTPKELSGFRKAARNLSPEELTAPASDLVGTPISAANERTRQQVALVEKAKSILAAKTKRIAEITGRIGDFEDYSKELSEIAWKIKEGKASSADKDRMKLAESKFGHSELPRDIEKLSRFALYEISALCGANYVGKTAQIDRNWNIVMVDAVDPAFPSYVIEPIED
jgi:hypothetical protein